MGRPAKTFEGFIGQPRVVRTLEALLKAMAADGALVPHIAFVGASGLGKSRLAEACARRAANCSDDDVPKNFHEVHAGRGYGPRLRERLVVARHGDFVFVDEAHAGGREDHELLYLAIDRHQTLALDKRHEKDTRGRLNRARFEPIAPVTFVFATNRPGDLPKALAARVTMIELEPYTQSQLRAIAETVAIAHHVTLTPQAARVLVQWADTPRRVEQLLTMTQRLRGSTLNQGDVEFVLRELGYDDHGTTTFQRRLLATLARAPDGLMTASDVVQTLGLDAAYVREELEAPLVRLRFLTIGPDRRRAITAAGRAVVDASGQAASSPEES